MSKLEKWIIIFLVVIIFTLLVSWIWLSVRFDKPPIIIPDGILVNTVLFQNLV